MCPPASACHANASICLPQLHGIDLKGDSNHFGKLDTRARFGRVTRMNLSAMPVLLGWVTIGVSSCAHLPMTSPLDAPLNEIRAASKPVHSERHFTPSERTYCAHYGLDVSEVIDHRFGFIDVGGHKIALHRYEPPHPRQVVVVSHGYYDHAGTWKHAIPALLAAGNTVVIYDHPGHGLSDGERASIADFREYADVFGRVVDDCRKETRLPIVFAGHSMGCAIITEYLLGRERAFVPARVVFVAPMVQSAMWNPFRFAHATLGRMVSSVPRIFQKNSSDEDYLSFVQQDPLHHRRVPMKWVGALLTWNKRAAGYPPASGLPLSILQGDKDGTLDWKYSVAFMQGKFPAATLRIFPGGRHQLLNEAEPMRSQVLQALINGVAEKPGK